MIFLFEPRVPVFVDVTAWQSWRTKALAAATGAQLIATPLEHNSAMVAFGNLLDELSDPSKFVTRQSTPLGGNGILFANYAGPEPQPYLVPANNANKYNGARLPVVGAGVAPSDPQQLTWWRAWQEIVSRFGAKWTPVQIAAVAQPTAADNMVLTDNVIAEAVVPLQQIPATQTLGILEDPDAAKYVAALFDATLAYAQRLVNTAAGQGTTADATQSALELASQPQITAIADQYIAEQKKTSLIGGAGLALAGALGLVMKRPRSRGRKR